ncbi:nucleoside triphosphate pyrophosphohydrolase [Marinicella litoralis]|uniref:Nucleoside triphosphate pyrophosphohydrolase n=1 Tax=Marinicella litoralis TaxID=644220 RepID=A0A4V3DHU4_9GAMM|nr:nucleoside triphosphate pyrophosphohydrolase [Marinicella litoralis]TDR19581.1 ATP diphosphatase [Marinicella litoralis]
MKKLLKIMQQLRDPQTGCPWDVKQSFQTIAPYTIEEAYEVADAIEQNDMQGLKLELGDLLFQVVFHSQMAQEAGLFNFTDVVDSVSDKMIERHPHVFQTAGAQLTAEQQTLAWEQAKSQDKASVVDGIAKNLPELLKAVKLTRYAAVIGFDWPDVSHVFDKLTEEVDELKEAMVAEDQSHIEEELGDVLFVIANLARHLQVDPSSALRKANIKFEKRFRKVEKLAKELQPKKESFDLDILDELWDQVKAELQNHDD